MKKCKFSFMIIITILITCHVSGKVSRIGENRTLYPKMTAIPPKIDGVLDDPAWQSGPIIKEPFVLYRPVYGEAMPQKTAVYISYDPDNIYFAFYCYENPERIKASMTSRDNFPTEDWVNVALDTMGNRQYLHEHACNAFGIQADGITSPTAGFSFDPDWVWYGAGKVVKDGYIVEMQIPLKSIQYKSGKHVRMNVLLYRKVSRSGVYGSWPEVIHGTDHFNSMASIVFEKLNRQLKLEAIPTATYGSIRDRVSQQEWSRADDTRDFGFSAKYGLTSSVNAELTINPDFSQVESDEFQIVANQRYPIFYSEKRPFFMEVGNQFNLAAAGGASNLTTAVHTRNIVAPVWGAKITGALDRLSFGVLAAGDEFPGRIWEEEINPHQGKKATFLIGRLKYGLKGDDYAGLITSSREFDGGYNRVIGGDLRFRLKGDHNIMIHGLYSFSRDSEANRQYEDGALTFKYDYSTKPLDLQLIFEHLGKDFRMDTAFIKRTGTQEFTITISPKFYPDDPKHSWITRISPFLFGYYLHDAETGMEDLYIRPGINFNFSRNGFMEIYVRHYRESWAGKTFPQTKIRIKGDIQLAKWLTISANLGVGQALYYDPLDPFVGNQFYFKFCGQLLPNDRLHQEFEYVYDRLNKKSAGDKVYDLHILVSKTTFQLNKNLFFRALVQYDSYSKVILSDLLASFTLIPGTVAQLGYGALYEKKDWYTRDRRGQLQPGLERYYHTKQSLFFKIGYRIRF